jgi:phospholipid/cholesterol/gamma-HCH transport system substrate-binding protein
MEREANYAAVGAFVLLVIVMGGLFVYWYSDARERRDYARYEIYFEGSVAGLERGAPVRYLGVDVGRVYGLSIDKRSARRVQVIADIDADTPISEQTVAELSLQGVTGMLYIDLLAHKGAKPVGAPVPSENYPVIPSVRSSFDLFLSSLPDVLAQANEVAVRASRVLSDENIASVTRTLKNIEAVAVRLPATMRSVETLVADLQSTANDAAAVANSLRALADEGAPQLRTAVEQAQTTATNLARATEHLEHILAENRGDLRSFTQQSLPELERLLRDGRAAAQEFRSLARSLRDDPSRLLYRPQERGVEIPQ